MRAYDFSPLFRSSVGFERLSSLVDTAMRQSEDALNGFPPYNIEKADEDSYRIVMAVAGFGEGDLEVVVTDNQLVVRGKANRESDNVNYLYRGIAGRAFERRFQLADFIKVTGAQLENGLLRIDLVREVPEQLRPRQVPIATGSGRAQAIEAKAA